jgi:hypothetical protein
MSSLTKILVIPGCGYQGSIDRIEGAFDQFEYIDLDSYDYVVLTGGIYTITPDGIISEHEIMEDKLLKIIDNWHKRAKNSLEKNRSWYNETRYIKRKSAIQQKYYRMYNIIVTDDKALDTYQNIENAIKIAIEYQEYNTQQEITFVSDKKHLRRFKISAPAIRDEINNNLKIPNTISFKYVVVSERKAILTALLERVLWFAHLLDPCGKGWLAKWNRKKRGEKNLGYRI